MLSNHQLYDNVYHDVYNDSAQPINATGNWWGVDTTNILATGTHPRNLDNIFDSYDDTAKGSVDYSAWLNLYAAPAVPIINAVVSPVGALTQVISGTKPADAGIVLNGVSVVPVPADAASESTNWSTTVNLAEGTNTFSFRTINAQGLYSNQVVTAIIKDTQAPTIFSSTPANGAVLNVNWNTIEIVLNESTTAIDLAASISTASVVDSLNNVVAGTWSTSGNNRLLFTAASIFAADSYTATVTPTDTPLNNSATASIQFVIDNQAPAAVTINTVTSPSNATPFTLSGGKEADTAVFVNNTPVVARDNLTSWSYEPKLQQGSNALSVTARDSAGNSSTAVDVSVVYDTVAPGIGVITPVNGSYSNQRPTIISMTVTEQISGVDLAASAATASVTQTIGNTTTAVSGSWELDINNVLIFTPGSPLPEAVYAVSLTVKDKAGNATAVNTGFTYDATPPALPVVNPVNSPTNSATETISGTKAANSSIWINNIKDANIVFADTNWSATVQLVEGINNFLIHSRDQAGNASGNVTVSIRYDDIAPLPVKGLLVNAQDTGSNAKLDWRSYDETLHGDIAGYRIYMATTLFTDVSGTPLATLPAGTQQYEVTGLTKGQTYFFAVVAYDSNGNANNSVTPKSVIVADVIPPVDVTNLSVVSGIDATSLTLNWVASSATDLANHKVYFGSTDTTGTLLGKAVTTQTITGLLAATGYTIKVTALDSDGNESAGVTTTGVTLMSNPIGLQVTPFSGLVELSWTAAAPVNLVKEYALYASTTPFTSIVGMTPALRVPAGQVSAKLAGLTNNTLYHFAVTTVNLSGGERDTGWVKSETPLPDSAGPTLSNVSYNGTVLSANTILGVPGTIRLDASDASGVSRVEFQVITSGTPDVVKILGTDTNGTDGYSSWWNVSDWLDGNHTLRLIGYDTLDNKTTLDILLTVALAAPAAPTINAPQNNSSVNTTSVVISGTAAKQTQVQLYNQVGTAAAVALGTPVVVDATGSFSRRVTLVAGTNNLAVTNNISAIASFVDGRGGDSVASTTVSVTVDTSIPDAPTGLSATARKGGDIKLVWNQSLDSKVVGYEVYRATSVFTEITAVGVEKANNLRITGTSYVDLPIAGDGTYYYRVIAVNDLETFSAPSASIDVITDGTAPKATLIDYTPQGPYDVTSGRMGPGQVLVNVTVNEPLLTTPFLSINPVGGVPLSVSLTRISDTEYRGSFTITETTPTALAYAVFSARDKVGNRGNLVEQGSEIKIDTDGPKITALNLSPGEPVKNDAVTPVTINFSLILDEPFRDATSFNLKYQLDGTSRTIPFISEELSGSLVQTDTKNWNGSILLPADAGTEAENLSFIYQGVDDLGNVSATIVSDNSFQIYQGNNLPPLDVPIEFSAIAQPGGKITLSWKAVEGAAEYQVYRKIPGGAWSDLPRTTNNTFIDTPTVEGEYLYAVASVRQANGEEGISAKSVEFSVIADATEPLVPTGLNLTLSGTGITASWVAPSGETGLSYKLYRSSTEILDLLGLTAIATDITETSYIDATPSASEQWYAVTAVDKAGNESAPSVSKQLNFKLLPVASLKVTQSGNTAPEVSWTYADETAINNYYLYFDDNKNVGTTLTVPNKTYTDTGYSGKDRLYTIVALDSTNSESKPRSLRLPQISTELQIDNTAISLLQRGVMNRLSYTVRNNSTVALDKLQLLVNVTNLEGTVTYPHQSAVFSLAAGASSNVDVVVGGYTNLSDTSVLTTTVRHQPNVGEQVDIIRSQDINVSDSALLVDLTTQDMLRGNSGKVRFSIENSSAVVTEIITALSDGANPSNEARFTLVDVDGNVLSSLPVQQVLNGVVKLSNGTTVARVAPGTVFTSRWFDLPVPGNAPDQVSVRLEIDHYHYHLGQVDHVSIGGASRSTPVVLTDTSYKGAFTAVSPLTSSGNQPIIITGRSMDRSTPPLPVAAVPLKLVISTNGFERQFTVYTDSNGDFSYSFTPLSGESGIYKVSVLHPDLLERPEQGQFVINRLSVSPTDIKLNIPYNYAQNINLRVTAGPGDGTVQEVRLVYDAIDQAGGLLPNGVSVTLGQALLLSASQSGNVSLTVEGDSATAAANGSLNLKALKVLRDGAGLETGTELISNVTVGYSFSAAVPVLNTIPNVLETGLAQGEITNETITLVNEGLAAMKNVRVTLLTQHDTAIPSWISLASTKLQGDIAVGGQRAIAIVAKPDQPDANGVGGVADGRYDFKLRVEADNLATTDIIVVVNVLQSGIGSIDFKVTDIYTNTQIPGEPDGVKYVGLAGANIQLQNEKVLSEKHTGVTGADGQVLIGNIPSGYYQFRVSADNHQETLGRVQIKAGTVLTQGIFLDYNLVTVEWSVTEIALQDSYEITLNATYETDVPAAVVVAEPASVTLPLMKAGEVFYGEFRLTNYGLINAKELHLNLPPNDEYVRYEIMAGLPAVLAASESIVVPYRAVALKSFDPTADGSGAGCYSYQACFGGGYKYDCANDTTSSGSVSHCFTLSWGQCSSGGGGSSGGASGGSSSFTYVGGTSSGSYTPVYKPIAISGDVGCVKDPDCKGPDCDCGNKPAGNSGGGS